MPLHQFHQALGAQFAPVNGQKAVAHYGDKLAEHRALRTQSGVLDLGFRSRLCLTGADRVRFLHGQVTNDIKRLRPGEGCYAALVTAKGRMESDLNIFYLPDELLLDFEPGLSQSVLQRLERFIVADDVQLVDVAPLYGLLSVQGPESETVVRNLGLFKAIPAESFGSAKITDPALGEVYLMNQARLGTKGFDLFVPIEALESLAGKLLCAAQTAGGRPCGWEACDMARIEAGIPRFGVDMDETNFPQECGIETKAVSYTKGCYIGQEVLNRIHTQGHVNRQLCGLRLDNTLQSLPARGDKVFLAGREVGYITSALASPALRANVALAYLRKEAQTPATQLKLHAHGEGSRAEVVALPFRLPEL